MFDEFEPNFRRKFSNAYHSTPFSSDSETEDLHRDLTSKNNMNISQTRLSNLQSTMTINPTSSSHTGSAGRRDLSFSIDKEQGVIQGSTNTDKSPDKFEGKEEEFV